MGKNKSEFWQCKACGVIMDGKWNHMCPAPESHPWNDEVTGDNKHVVKIKTLPPKEDLKSYEMEGLFSGKCPTCLQICHRGEPRYTLKELEERELILSLRDLKKTVECSKRLLKFIEEPHYSIAELEKIWKHLTDSPKVSFNEYTKLFPGENAEYIDNFLTFLKDKKKVEEILNVK